METVHWGWWSRKIEGPWAFYDSRIASSALDFLPRPFFYMREKLTSEYFKPLLFEILVTSSKTHYSVILELQSSVYNIFSVDINIDHSHSGGRSLKDSVGL